MDVDPVQGAPAVTPDAAPAAPAAAQGPGEVSGSAAIPAADATAGSSLESSSSLSPLAQQALNGNLPDQPSGLTAQDPGGNANPPVQNADGGTGADSAGSPQGAQAQPGAGILPADSGGDPKPPSASDIEKNTNWQSLGTVTLSNGVTVQARFDPNDPNAKAAAQEVLDNAGGDLNKLSQIFGVDSGQLGSRNWVVDVTNQWGGATHASGTGPDATHILEGDAKLDQPGATQYGSAGLFVAEATEVFEAKTEGKLGWNEIGTNGEGLSRALAIGLHPEFASDPTIGQGAIETGWWNRSNDQYRPDWINQNITNDGYGHGGDNDSDANGQGTLFLMYEHNQLGYSWAQIAQAGGNTLADNYHNLTGDSASQALPNFLNSLSALTGGNPAAPPTQGMQGIGGMLGGSAGGGNLTVPPNADPYGDPSWNLFGGVPPLRVPPYAVPLPPAGT